MFRGLFGSKNSESPGPPKNQIEVVCPVCGAAQYEPRLVVSTFCKRCGVHLKKDGKRIIASDVSKAGGVPDALAPRRSATDSAAPATQPIAPAPSARIAVAGPRPMTGPLTPMTPGSAVSDRMPVPLPQDLPDISETGELGLGMMLQAAVAGPSTPVSPKPATVPLKEPQVQTELGLDLPPPPEKPLEKPGAGATSVADNVPVSVAELMQQNAANATPGTLQRMRDQGLYRNHNFKEAQCFECDHKFKVGRSSRSANCPSCGAYISLEDVELNMPSTQAIKTRGDVLIRKRGQLTASSLYARDLRCFGLVSANINCSGDAIFKTSGTIIGEVRCKKFVVEKGSDIEFLNEVHADEIEISAKAKGHFFSRGKLIIQATGAVDGSVTGRSISIEPGGELNGAMNIVRAAT